MVWAQVFPFVALQFSKNNNLDADNELVVNIEIFLVCSCAAWLILNVVFFYTIDINYLKTFFDTKTGPQWCVDCFLSEGSEDIQKFNVVFDTNLNCTKVIRKEVKEWVSTNIESWKEEQSDWFKIEMIPDDYLPKKVVEEEGGAKRRRRSYGLRESFGFASTDSNNKYAPESSGRSLVTAQNSRARLDNQEKWRGLAEDIYETRSNNHKSNFTHVKLLFHENEELLAPILVRCPLFREILSYILEDRLGLRIKRVSYTSDMKDWQEKECKRVGCALATFLRNRKTGEHAIDAWRLHYVQLNELFEEVEGFEDFILVIANNTLRDSIYGTVYRVSVGAALSTIDAATNIYVVSAYYQSDELVGQARAMLAMILTNTVLQLFTSG